MFLFFQVGEEANRSYSPPKPQTSLGFGEGVTTSPKPQTSLGLGRGSNYSPHLEQVWGLGEGRVTTSSPPPNPSSLQTGVGGSMRIGNVQPFIENKVYSCRYAWDEIQVAWERAESQSHAEENDEAG